MCDNDEHNYSALINRQTQTGEDVITHKNILFLSTRSTVAVQWGDGGL